MAVRYRPAGRALHWLIAALALAALASGYLLTRPGSYSVTLLQVHLAFGAAAGLLSLIRVLLWLTLGAPPPVFETPTRLQANLSGSVHILLRLVPLLLLVSGAGMMILSGAYSAIAGARWQAWCRSRTCRPAPSTMPLRSCWRALSGCTASRRSGTWRDCRISGHDR